MYSSDTATSLMRSEARPGLNQQFNYNTAYNNSLSEAVVVKVGPLENFECSIIVYIHSVRETFKLEAGLGIGASAETSTGNYAPFFVGDKVLVSFVNGDSSRPTLIGRLYDQSGLSERLMQPGAPVPVVGAVTPSGVKVRPNPLATRTESSKDGGFVNLTVYPMLLP